MNSMLKIIENFSITFNNCCNEVNLVIVVIVFVCVYTCFKLYLKMFSLAIKKCTNDIYIKQTKKQKSLIVLVYYYH